MRWIEFTRPDLAPEAVLGLLAVGLGLLDALLWPRRESRAPVYATLFGLLLALSLALEAWELASPARDGWLAADAAAAFADLLIITGAVLAALLAAATSRSVPDRAGSGVLIALSALGATVAVSARDLVVLFVGLELTSLSLLAYNAMAAGPGTRAALRQAGPGAAATALTLFGIGCLWSVAGDPTLASSAEVLRSDPPVTAVVGAGFLLTGVAIRAGVVPFHPWLTEVAAGCSPAAVMLTLCTGVVPAVIVAGRVAQMLTWVGMETLLLAGATLSMTVANLLALPQRRLARLLGCGIVVHVGLALVAVVAAPAGRSPALWLQLASLVAAAAGLLGVRAMLGDGDEEPTSGLARREPGVGVALCLFLLAFAGLPPTVAFAARATLMSGLADSLTGAVGAILLANAVCTAYVFVRFAGRVVFDERRTAPSSTATPETVAVVVLAAALLVTFGLWPEPLASAAALAGAG